MSSLPLPPEGAPAPHFPHDRLFLTCVMLFCRHLIPLPELQCLRLPQRPPLGQPCNAQSRAFARKPHACRIASQSPPWCREVVEGGRFAGRQSVLCVLEEIKRGSEGGHK
mmetsp:Transcript_26536/g.64484  ORF Transcript_26536/g.64484 Transcript_26536/m.64484 type:complete len:110 (-) Transcript_26536:6604-6933(-)